MPEREPRGGDPARTDMAPGYQSLRDTFVGASLAVPPVPGAMRSRLLALEPWVWATRTIDPMKMYMFMEYPAAAAVGKVGDYVAVSHAGHGINSYAINYHLVYGSLALFAQTAWGGVYTDPVKSAQALAEQLSACGRLIEAVDSMPEVSDRRRLLVMRSDFRDVAVCQWVTGVIRSQDEAMRWVRRSVHPPGDPLRLARDLLLG